MFPFSRHIKRLFEYENIVKKNKRANFGKIRAILRNKRYTDMPRTKCCVFENHTLKAA